MEKIFRIKAKNINILKRKIKWKELFGWKLFCIIEEHDTNSHLIRYCLFTK